MTDSLNLEAILANQIGSVAKPNYEFALIYFSLGAILAMIIFAAIGKEARGIELTYADEEEPALGEVPQAQV